MFGKSADRQCHLSFRQGLSDGRELFLVPVGYLHKATERSHFCAFFARFGIEVCEQITVDLDAVFGRLIFFHARYVLVVILFNQIRMNGRERLSCKQSFHWPRFSTAICNSPPQCCGAIPRILSAYRMEPPVQSAEDRTLHRIRLWPP